MTDDPLRELRYVASHQDGWPVVVAPSDALRIVRELDRINVGLALCCNALMRTREYLRDHSEHDAPASALAETIAEVLKLAMGEMYQTGSDERVLLCQDCQARWPWWYNGRSCERCGAPAHKVHP